MKGDGQINLLSQHSLRRNSGRDGQQMAEELDYAIDHIEPMLRRQNVLFGFHKVTESDNT